MKAISALPFLRWFPLSRETLKADLIAGLTVALLLVPQSMAYAQLAGLPPYYGLCTSLVPTVLAALFGWCPQLHTGPVAMTSMLTASVLAGVGLAVPGSSEYIALAALLALLVGVIRIIMGFCRLATLASLFSHPVIVAFTTAGAAIIAFSQLGHLLGIPMPSTGCYARDVLSVVRQSPSAHIPTVVLSASVLAALIAFKVMLPRLPGAMITVVAATLVCWLVDFGSGMGGNVVGAVPGGLHVPTLPRLDAGTVWQLLHGAAVITLIGLLEVMAVSKSIAAKTGQRLNLNQELIGQGVANLGGAFFQAFPASGSLSRSALKPQSSPLR